MHVEDRLIHFSTELIHVPVQHQVPVLQRLYYELSQRPGLGYDNTDFTVPAQLKFYSRRGQRTQSLLIFLPDRVALVEEWADTSLNQFVERVKGVGEMTRQVLGLSPYLGQSVTLRSTFSLTHSGNAAEFLLANVCGLAGQVEPHFGRPLMTSGLRFIFPETPEHAGNIHLLIESFRHDPRDVFVETKGIFGRPGEELGGVEAAAANIQATRRVIVDSVFPFLDQFDRPARQTS